MQLRRRAEELLELADKIEKESKDNGNQVSGDIFIGSGETQQFHTLSRLMKQFSEDHPQARYHLFIVNADDIKEKINSGLIDLALLTEPVSMEHFDFIRLKEKDTWGVVMLKK